MSALPVDNEVLPKFDNPPVAEVAIGIEFVPVPGLDTVRLVKAHSMWSDNYPKIVQQPALPPSAQPVGLAAGTGLHIGFGFDALRMWMLAEDERTLLQLQNDRLILNWRRLGSPTYPSYGDLLPEYLSRWDDLVSYLADAGAVEPLLADVTYVNGVQSPSGGRDLAAVSSAFAGFPSPGRLASCSARFVAEIPGTQGHTSYTFEPTTNEGETNLTIVSRVAIPQGSDAPSLRERVSSALDYAHAASVLGFASITTPELHESWGRTQ